MSKRSIIFFILIAILVAALPVLAQDEDEEELICPNFEGDSADVRTSYYMGEGAAFFNSGQLNSALHSFSCIIEQVNGSYIPAYMHRAAVHAARRDYESAIDDYTRAIGLDSSLVPAYNNRGVMYAALREYEDAIDDFSTVLDLDADYIDAYNNRAVIYTIVGEFELAIGDLETAISRSGIDDVVTNLTRPDRPQDEPRPEYNPAHAQSYALLGIVYSAYSLDNYENYILLRGGSADRRIQAAAGALESRFSFELRLDDGTWLLVAQFDEQ